MKGLLYQLKSVRKDKFCIMSFLLPIVVAVALNFVGSIDLSSLGEFHFGVTAKATTSEVNTWLERYGTVTVYPTQEELIEAINEPSTNLIGVEMSNGSIQTILSGDELDMFQQTANTLPALYEQREWAAQASVQVLERPDMMAGYQNIFIAITLIVAMFMGCTFNAMNIISEKEDGVALINEILPMTHRQYMMQKIFVGFVFGCLSAILTAAICFRLSFTGAAVMLALIVLSAFVSALIGLFVGKLSDGMMVGVVYIKIVMIVFMAVPILNYLVGAGNKVLSYICYLIPSSATFEGIMDLANGTASTQFVIRSGSYMDDLVLFGRRWADIQSAARKLTKWALTELGLTIKNEWVRVDFLSAAEEHQRRHLTGAAKGCPGLDMAGYVMHRTYTTIRPRIFLRARRQYIRAKADVSRNGYVPVWRSYKLVSYNGYFDWTKSRAISEALKQKKLFTAAKVAIRVTAQRNAMKKVRIAA